MANITFRGREVTSPVLRPIVATIAAIGGGLGVIVGFLVVILLLALTPVLVPIHLLLRKFGRRGFYYTEGSSFYCRVEPAAFRRI